ncbi:MAG: saccharopine dehydrogenase family protein [Solirubrobacteraceae bacterium]
MAGRIVLLGATGYTGDLTARAMVARGTAPVLAGRSEERVRALASELGGLEWATADVERAGSVRALVERGDVLVTTVGPFTRYGEPAVRAAIDAGAHYLDSSGEPSFIRAVFERWGPEAKESALLTAFGADWVPGNLAGALALRDAGPEAVRLEVGYYAPGPGLLALSGGTRASAVSFVLEPGFAFHDGRIVEDRAGSRLRSFPLAGGKHGAGVSVAASEHFTLPRLAPGLRDVDVFLGWFGPASRPLQGVSLATSALTRLPGVRDGLDALSGRLLRGSSGGPDARSRATHRTFVIAEAFDGAGGLLSESLVEGVNAYDFTAGVLAWGAQAAASGAVQGTGALGPAEAFGLDALARGCAEAGIAPVAPSPARPAA